MFTDTTSIQLFSRKPLWYINEEGEIGYIQNTYSDAEIVRVVKNTHITNYPITEYLTVIPELDTILFEKQEYAITGLSMMEEFGNQDLLLQNSQQINMHSDCYSADGCNVPSGLYSYSEFDNLIDGSLNINELRYLNRDEKIKKIHSSSEDQRLNEILTEYIRYEDVQVVHHNENSEKLIFDILCENNKVWIKHFWVVDNGVDIGPVPFMISPLNGFLMFTSKPNAAYYRNDVREGNTTAFTAMVGNGQQRSYNGAVRKQIKAQKKNAVIQIVNGVKDIVTTFISTDKLIGLVIDKTTPNVVRLYKRAASKARAKKRKAEFLKRNAS